MPTLAALHQAQGQRAQSGGVHLGVRRHRAHPGVQVLVYARCAAQGHLHRARPGAARASITAATGCSPPTRLPTLCGQRRASFSKPVLLQHYFRIFIAISGAVGEGVGERPLIQGDKGAPVGKGEAGDGLHSRRRTANNSPVWSVVSGQRFVIRYSAGPGRLSRLCAHTGAPQTRRRLTPC